MTAINRPIDILLNNETLKANPARRESSPLTDSNKKENSFGELLSARQKEVAARDNKAADTGTKDNAAQAKSQQAEPGAEAQATTESGGKEVVDNGKDLPPEQAEVVTPPANETAKGAETASLELESLVGEEVIAVQTLATAEPKLAPDELVVTEDSQLSAAGVLNPEHQLAPQAAESVAQSPTLILTDRQNGTVQLAKEPTDADGLSAEAGTLTQTLAVTEAKVVAESDKSLTAEKPIAAPVIEPNIRLELAGQNTAGTEEAPAAAVSSAIPQAALAATVPGSLAAQDQLKQAAPIAAAVEDSLKLKPHLDLGETKVAKKIDFSLPPDVKIDVSAQNQVRQLPFGFELKQWLSEARAMLDPAAANITSARESDLPTAANALTPARLNSLTQAVQGLMAAPREAVSVNIQAPVNSAAWGQVVAQRIAWLAGNGVRAAELQLNPQELGPVDVKISVNNEKTSIHFTSQHAAVRDALELSVQRLRDMLESNGLGLADVNVSDQPGSRERETTAEQSQATFAGEQSQDQNIEGPLVRIAATNSLVDYYV